MDAIAMIALTMGVAWASGINLYAAVLTLGILGSTGHIVLPPGLAVLQHPAVLGAAGVMYFLEFFADKIPGLDSLWDAVHTFIRIPAGAILAARAVGSVSPEAELVAALLGGVLAASTHVAKAGGRAVLNVSPEPVTNWIASIGEDTLVIAGLWTAATHPAVFLVGLFVFLLLVAWLLPKLWHALVALFRRGSALLRRRTVSEQSTDRRIAP